MADQDILIKQSLDDIASADIQDKEALEAFRLKYLGKKGVVKLLYASMKELPEEDRKVYGQTVNKIKAAAEAKYDEVKRSLDITDEEGTENLDLTMPSEPLKLGSRHPVSIIQNQLVDIFTRIGFTVSEGPEIEDDWHNFGALNIPEDHPARDMQDTFFVETDPNIVLRTHTSSVQVRVMNAMPPPIRTISPGRVFRNETISARAHCFFHQVEGLFIDEGVSFADLKQTLFYFAKEMFGPDIETRLRPSYFPFTEPSGEMDISCLICKGKGCSVCKNTGWVEILGCGMVDPAVLDNCKIDQNKYTGFAFGMGVERIAMLKYKINDIRILFENDVRFLDQFNSLKV